MNRNIAIAVVAGIAASVFASGCATSGSHADDPYYSARDKSQTLKLHTDLVREMIAQDRYYAALAHIDELEKAQGGTDELRLLKAQVLAKLGRRQEAEQAYTSLLSGSFEGEARHGLGLLYAESNYPLSLKYLQVAARLLPTNAEIRNDLGYALLLGGYYREGQLQLATAYELDAASERNRNNYVLSLLLLMDDAAVRRMQQAGTISVKQLDALRKKARGWPQIVRRTRSVVPASSPAVPAKAASSAARSWTKAESRSVKDRLSSNQGF